MSIVRIIGGGNHGSGYEFPYRYRYSPNWELPSHYYFGTDTGWDKLVEKYKEKQSKEYLVFYNNLMLKVNKEEVTMTDKGGNEFDLLNSQNCPPEVFNAMYDALVEKEYFDIIAFMLEVLDGSFYGKVLKAKEEERLTPAEEEKETGYQYTIDDYFPERSQPDCE